MALVCRRNAFVAVLAVTTLVGVHAAGVGSGKIAARLSHRRFRDRARLRMRSSSHRGASTPVHAAWRAGDEAHKLQNRVKNNLCSGGFLTSTPSADPVRVTQFSFRALECSSIAADIIPRQRPEQWDFLGRPRKK